MRKILIVDDDPTVMALAAAYLRAAEYEVRTTKDVWIASLVREYGPELVMVEVKFGEGPSGMRLVESLKAMTSLRRMKVYLWSSLPEDTLERYATSCGADGWIKKGKLLVPRVRDALS